MTDNLGSPKAKGSTQKKRNQNQSKQPDRTSCANCWRANPAQRLHKSKVHSGGKPTLHVQPSQAFERAARRRSAATRQRDLCIALLPPVLLYESVGVREAFHGHRRD